MIVNTFYVFDNEKKRKLGLILFCFKRSKKINANRQNLISANLSKHNNNGSQHVHDLILKLIVIFKNF